MQRQSQQSSSSKTHPIQQLAEALICEFAENKSQISKEKINEDLTSIIKEYLKIYIDNKIKDSADEKTMQARKDMLDFIANEKLFAAFNQEYSRCVEGPFEPLGIEFEFKNKKTSPLSHVFNLLQAISDPVEREFWNIYILDLRNKLTFNQAEKKLSELYHYSNLEYKHSHHFHQEYNQVFQHVLKNLSEKYPDYYKAIPAGLLISTPQKSARLSFFDASKEPVAESRPSVSNTRCMIL